jgi:hypothetical protein
MADFCNKCSIEMGFPTPDIDVYKIFDSLQPGFFETHICEGCGFVGIARSENDELFVIHQNGDGESVFYNYEKYEGLKIDDNEQ